MDKLKTTVSSGSNFAGLYILLMIPTYILPYFGSNSIIVNMVHLAAGGAGLVLLLAHVALLIGLCVIAHARGKVIDKGWLIAFPVMAAIFDIVPLLNFIPLIPTLFHAGALAIGASGDREGPPDVFS